METSVKETAKTLDQAEKDLLSSVALKEPTSSGLELQLAKFRDACVNLYFLDLEPATSKDVETRLWAAHGRVNSKFRSYLATFRSGPGKKKKVECRKAEALYKAFIKSSTAFYRGFIQRIAAHFKDVPEIFNIAVGFGLNPLSADAEVEVAVEQKHALLRSCHTTLIHLGDLSRYRETEIPKNPTKRNWGPAVGYYDLAGSMNPSDGQAFNQRAVISLSENDHLRAVYHLYRALTVANPPEPAKGNIELEFKKIRSRHARNEPLLAVDTTSVDPKLETAFLNFHARAYADTLFDDYQDQIVKIVSGFAQALKSKPYDSAAKKMCLINIAASHYAQERALHMAETDRDKASGLMKAYERFQDLNILTYMALLQLLANELEGIVAEGVGEMDQASCIARISPVCGRVLPHLRLYTLWFMTTAGFLLNAQSDTRFQRLPQLWAQLVATLNTVMTAFPLQKLSDAPYLLDEDQDIVAFTAFSDKAKDRHLLDSNQTLKPIRSAFEISGPQQRELEMLMRVRAFVQDGSYIYRHGDDLDIKAIPIAFSNMRFVFTGETTSWAAEHLGRSSSESIPSAILHDTTIIENGVHDSSISARVIRSRTDDMAHMVDELVGTEAMASEVPHIQRHKTQAASSSVVNGSPSSSRPASGRLKASDLVRQMQQSSPAPLAASPSLRSAHRISLPGIWNTPFTPRPGESSSSLSRPSTSHQPNGLATSPGAGEPPSSDALAFEHQIAQMQQNLQKRSSPLQPFDPTVTPASYIQTPTGFDTFLRQNAPPRPTNSSPWISSDPSSSGTSTELPRPAAQASPFGAIGESRPKSAKTPTSGQPG